MKDIGRRHVLQAMGLTALTAATVEPVVLATGAAAATVVSAVGAYRAAPAAYRNVSDGIATGVNTRAAHQLVPAASRLRLVYANWAASGGGGSHESTAGLAAVTVSASVEYPVGVFTQIRFGGSSTVTLAPGASVVSDPVSVAVPAGAWFWSRTYATVPAGGVWPGADGVNLGWPWYEASSGDTQQTDLTMGGSISGAFAYPFVPHAVVTDTAAASSLRVLGLGDSITSGVGDQSPDYAFAGWFAKAFSTKVLAQRASLSGERLAGYATGGMAIRLPTLSRGCNTAICALGINDVTAGASQQEIETAMLAIWGDVSRRGMKAWQTTLTPVAASTDQWQTVAGQTPDGGSPVRAAVNDWLRDGAPVRSGVPAATGSRQSGTVRVGSRNHPLTGVIDFAAVCESSRNSGRWKVNGTAAFATADGTHPSAEFHTRLAAAVPLTALSRALSG